MHKISKLRMKMRLKLFDKINPDYLLFDGDREYKL